MVDMYCCWIGTHANIWFYSFVLCAGLGFYVYVFPRTRLKKWERRTNGWRLVSHILYMRSSRNTPACGWDADPMYVQNFAPGKSERTKRAAEKAGRWKQPASKSKCWVHCRPNERKLLTWMYDHTEQRCTPVGQSVHQEPWGMPHSTTQ